MRLDSRLSIDWPPLSDNIIKYLPTLPASLLCLKRSDNPRFCPACSAAAEKPGFLFPAEEQSGLDHL